MAWNPKDSSAWQGGMRRDVAHGDAGGFHILASPPGQQAPIQHINYTPSTNEVHGRGALAPLDKLNYTLMPSGDVPSDMGAGVGGRSAGGGVAIGTGMIGAGADAIRPGYGTAPPGQSGLGGRYSSSPSTLRNTFAPGQPPLQPHPFITGPGPHSVVSGSGPRPFQERSSTSGITTGWGTGAGQDESPAQGVQQFLQGLPVVGPLFGGGQPPQPAPAPDFTPVLSPDSGDDTAGAAARGSLWDQAAGGSANINPDAATSDAAAVTTPVTNVQSSTGGSDTVKPTTATSGDQGDANVSAEQLAQQGVHMVPSQWDDRGQPTFGSLVDGQGNTVGTYTVNPDGSIKPSSVGRATTSGTAGLPFYVGDFGPAGKGIVDQRTGQYMIIPGSATPPSGQAVQAGAAGTLTYDPYTGSWTTVPGSQAQSELDAAKSRQDMSVAAYNIGHPAPQLQGGNVVTPPGATSELNYPDVPWAPAAQRGRQVVSGGPLPAGAQAIEDQTNQFLNNWESQYPGGMIPPASVGGQPPQQPAPAPAPPAAPPEPPGLQASQDMANRYAKGQVYPPAPPMPPGQGGNLDLPPLPPQGGMGNEGAGADNFMGRGITPVTGRASTGIGWQPRRAEWGAGHGNVGGAMGRSGMGGSGIGGGGGVGQEQAPTWQQMAAAGQSPNIPPVFDAALQQPVPLASDPQHQQPVQPPYLAKQQQVGGGNLMGGGQETPPTPLSPGPPMGAPGPGGAGPAGWAPPVSPQDVAGIGHRFGQQMDQGEPQHSGVDMQAEEGTSTLSPVDGFVIRVEHNPQGLGLTVVIQGKDGSEHRLGHLQHTDAYPGMQVHQGQQIAKVGSTGNTTGSHLHWGVKDGQGQPQDPTPALPPGMQQMPPVPGTQMMGPPGGTGGSAQVGAGVSMTPGAQGAQHMGSPGVGQGEADPRDTGDLVRMQREFSNAQENFDQPPALNPGSPLARDMEDAAYRRLDATYPGLTDSPATQMNDPRYYDPQGWRDIGDQTNAGFGRQNAGIVQQGPGTAINTGVGWTPPGHAINQGEIAPPGPAINTGPGLPMGPAINTGVGWTPPQHIINQGEVSTPDVAGSELGDIIDQSQPYQFPFSGNARHTALSQQGAYLAGKEYPESQPYPTSLPKLDPARDISPQGTGQESSDTRWDLYEAKDASGFWGPKGAGQAAGEAHQGMNAQGQTYTITKSYAEMTPQEKDDANRYAHRLGSPTPSPGDYNPSDPNTYHYNVDPATQAGIDEQRYQAQLQAQQAIQALQERLQEVMIANGQAVLMQQGTQAFQDYQTRQQDQMQLLNSALSSPWIQELSGVSPIPGMEGKPTGVPDILNQMGQIFKPYDPNSWVKGSPYAPPPVQNQGTVPGVPSLGGNPPLPSASATTGAPQGGQPPAQGGQPPAQPGAATQAAAAQGDQGGLYMGANQPADQSAGGLPSGYHWNNDQTQILDANNQPTGWYVPTWQQWQGWNPYQKQAYRLSIERYGQGAWNTMQQQMNKNFRQQGATSQSANLTPLQASSADTGALAGSQMTADVLGQGGNWPSQQGRLWSSARAPGVQQKMTAGIAA